jgi:hypothetical protein
MAEPWWDAYSLIFLSCKVDNTCLVQFLRNLLDDFYKVLKNIYVLILLPFDTSHSLPCSVGIWCFLSLYCLLCLPRGLHDLLSWYCQ